MNSEVNVIQELRCSIASKRRCSIRYTESDVVQWCVLSAGRILLSADYEQRRPLEQVEAHSLAFSRTGALALHALVSLSRHAPLLAFRLPRFVEDPQGIEYAGRRKLRAVDGHVRTIESVWGAHEVVTLVMAMQRGRDVHV